MTLIEWRPEFATGIPAVDHEHQELIALLNLFHGSIGAGKDAEAVEAFLGEVFTAISAHFALEEKIMRERRYDQYRAHKDDHERLLDEIRDIMDAQHADGGLHGDALSARLERWFVRHFKDMDARLHRVIGGH